MEEVATWRGVNLGGWLVVEEWMTPGLLRGVKAREDASKARSDASTTSSDASALPKSMREEWRLVQALGPWRARSRLRDHYTRAPTGLPSSPS